MSDDFSARYRLLKCVLVEDGIRTHNAQEASTGRVVMVHITDAAGPDEVERLRAQLAQLPAGDKNKVLETATLTSGFVVVTEFLPTPLSFRGWLAAHATGASAPSAPTGSSRGFTADGTAIPVSEVPSAPLVTATSAARQNGAPAAAPAAGGFTALFGTPVDPMAAVAPTPVIDPVSVPAPIPVAPPAAVAPPPAPPKPASGGSFTELFGMPSDPLKAPTPMTLGGKPVKTDDIVVAIPPASAPAMPVASTAAPMESISALMAAPAFAAAPAPLSAGQATAAPTTPTLPAPIAATPAPAAAAPAPTPVLAPIAAPPRKEPGDFTKMFSPGSLDMGAMSGFAAAPLGATSEPVRPPAVPPAPVAMPSSMPAAPPASMMAAPASPMAASPQSPIAAPPPSPLAAPAATPMAAHTPPAMPLSGPPAMAMHTPPAMPLSGPPPMAMNTPPAMPIPQPPPVPPVAAPTPAAAPAPGFAEFGWGQNAAPAPAARKAPPGEFTAMFGAPATAAPMPDSLRPSPMSSAPPPTFSAMTPDQRLESPPVEPMHRVMGSNPNYAGGINQAGPSPIAPNLVSNYPYGAGGYPAPRPPEPSYPAAHASPLFAQEKKFAGEPSSTPGILPPPIFSSGSSTPLSALGGASPQIRGNAGPSEFTQLISNGSAPIVPTLAPSSAASSAASAAAAKPAKRRLPTGLIVIANAVILVFVLLMFFVYRRSVPSVSSLTPVVRAPIMPTAPKIPTKP